MPYKLRAFRLSDETVAKLDAIARSLPKGPTGLPATRTDALNLAVDRLHGEITRNTPDGRRRGDSP